jgi:hypothetical protein
MFISISLAFSPSELLSVKGVFGMQALRHWERTVISGEIHAESMIGLLPLKFKTPAKTTLPRPISESFQVCFINYHIKEK